MDARTIDVLFGEVAKGIQDASRKVIRLYKWIEYRMKGLGVTCRICMYQHLETLSPDVTSMVENSLLILGHSRQAQRLNPRTALHDV